MNEAATKDKPQQQHRKVKYKNRPNSYSPWSEYQKADCGRCESNVKADIWMRPEKGTDNCPWDYQSGRHQYGFKKIAVTPQVFGFFIWHISILPTV